MRLWKPSLASTDNVSSATEIERSTIVPRRIPGMPSVRNPRNTHVVATKADPGDYSSETPAPPFFGSNVISMDDVNRMVAWLPRKTTQTLAV